MGKVKRVSRKAPKPRAILELWGKVMMKPLVKGRIQHRFGTKGRSFHGGWRTLRNSLEALSTRGLAFLQDCDLGQGWGPLFEG